MRAAVCLATSEATATAARRPSAATMAEAFTLLWSRRDATMEEWRVLQEAADLTREEERESCVRIQKLWRGQRIRAWVSVMRAACIEIERVFRGHLGRTRRDVLAKARTEACLLIAMRIRAAWVLPMGRRV